jgi:hypothetical protein
MREKLIDIVEAYADFLDWDTKEDMVDSIMEKCFATDNNVGHKWISVKDRLPENDTYVNVATDGVVAQAYWYNDKFYEFTSIGVATVGGVTHWMPLPKPPKGE